MLHSVIYVGSRLVNIVSIGCPLKCGGGGVYKGGNNRRRDETA